MKKEEIIKVIDKIRNRINILNKDLIDTEQIVFLNNIHADLIKLLQSIKEPECEHEEKLNQGDGFVYVTCSKCGNDL